MLAQSPPAEVDQALRARTTEFFQDFVEGKYTKAFDFVAEQSRDEYFASSKANIKEFHIDNIQYSDNFSRATVNLSVKVWWTVQGQQALADVKMSTTWKIENGKWMWYHENQPDTMVTPMGPSDVSLVMKKPDGSIAGLPEKMTPEVIAAAGEKILQQSSSLNKNQVLLAPDKASSDKVVFHNGSGGSVSLELLNVPKIPGFTAKIYKADVNFNQDAVVEIAYTPPPDLEPGTGPQSASLSLLVSPFNQVFGIEVKFGYPTLK